MGLLLLLLLQVGSLLVLSWATTSSSQGNQAQRSHSVCAASLLASLLGSAPKVRPCVVRTVRVCSALKKGREWMAQEINQREINIGQLSIEQLNGLKSQHEEELRSLQSQLETLHGAKNRFINARSTLDEIKTSTEGAPLLIPLNGSLYVPGKISDPNKVLVELGTGYFCEKTVAGAKDLIDRKTQLVTTSIDSVASIGERKRKNLDQIMQVMSFKLQQMG